MWKMNVMLAELWAQRFWGQTTGSWSVRSGKVKQWCGKTLDAFKKGIIKGFFIQQLSYIDVQTLWVRSHGNAHK